MESVPRVSFKNQPKLSGQEVDKKRDELRLSLVSHIEQYLVSDELFKGKNVSVEFSHEGVSSLVSFVEVENEKFVLKIPLNDTVPEGSEALFLRTWEVSGVPVQRVIQEGRIDDRLYILMRYVDAPTVEEKYKEENEEKEKVYFEAGKILRLMHEPEAVGFGKYIDGRGQYNSFEEWLNSDDMRKREGYVQAAGLLSDDHGDYSRAKEILIENFGKGNKSSYCHFDFSTGHLFATKPPTVFDPNPFFNHGYIDLGRTLVNYIAQRGTYPEKIVEGYSQGETVGSGVLRASIYLNVLYKLPYQHKKGRDQVIKNFQDYLAKYAHLLG